MPEMMTRAGYGAFADPRTARRYRTAPAVLLLLAPVICYCILTRRNPMPVDSPGFWRIAQMRVTSVAVILMVAWCQVPATVAFQTITSNRIITPSITGFESLYRLAQTSTVFFLGTAGLASANSTGQYLMQVRLMVALVALLYGWMLRNEHTNIYRTLLLGIAIGTGLGALSTYMQNLLNPPALDILSVRLIGNISNADVSQPAVTTPLALVTGGLLLAMSRTLDVLGLGRDAAIGLGADHRRNSLVILMLTAVLMAVSTSLVGPMSFLGFLVAMTAYQLSDTREHRFALPMVWLVGVMILGGAYFILRHIFYVTDFVGIIIEAVDGTFFLIHLLRKGRLWPS